MYENFSANRGPVSYTHLDVYKRQLLSNNLTLLVPSDFYKEYIEDNYLSLLSAALKKNIGKGVKLWYSVMENNPVGQDSPITVSQKGKSIATPKIQEALPPSMAPNLILSLIHI